MQEPDFASTSTVNPSIVDRFSAFVIAERERYEGDDNNRVAFSLSQVGRYLRFVGIAMDRYRCTNNEVVVRFRRKMNAIREACAGANKTISRELTPHEVAEGENDALLHNQLHYEIESFFLFAKILLDRISHFVGDFFGAVREVSLKSHDKWCKGINHFSRSKNLTLPEGIVETMDRLSKAVADYRDKQITHLKNPRASHGTIITGEGATRISMSPLYPRDNDRQADSPGVDEVVAIIEIYLLNIVELVESNREKTRYKLRSR